MEVFSRNKSSFPKQYKSMMYKPSRLDPPLIPHKCEYDINDKNRFLFLLLYLFHFWFGFITTFLPCVSKLLFLSMCVFGSVIF